MGIIDSNPKLVFPVDYHDAAMDIDRQEDYSQLILKQDTTDGDTEY